VPEERGSLFIQMDKYDTIQCTYWLVARASDEFQEILGDRFIGISVVNGNAGDTTEQDTSGNRTLEEGNRHRLDKPTRNRCSDKSRHCSTVISVSRKPKEIASTAHPS